MRVLAPVKQVALIRDGVAVPEQGPPPPEALAWRLNEWDELALETAMSLVEAPEEGEVVVAAVGPAQAEDGLRECLARGAARAVRVWDESLAEEDPLAVARILAALVERERPEVIVCGAQAADEASGCTPAALAGLLELPRVLSVGGVRRDGAALLLERELAGGAIEVVRVQTPALLAVQSCPARPRRPNLRAIKAARGAPLQTLTPADLGLDGAELRASRGARVRALQRPARRGAARILEGTPAEIAASIGEIVRAQR